MSNPRPSFHDFLAEHYLQHVANSESSMSSFEVWESSLSHEELVNFAEIAIMHAYDLLDLKVQEVKKTI